MSIKTFFTISALVPFVIGIFVIMFPVILIENVKIATSCDSAVVMARTVGVLLTALGILNFAIRDCGNSSALKTVLFFNLIIHLGIMPIDPMAYAQGIFNTLGSFVPNTLIHITLAGGCIYYLLKIKPDKPIVS